MDNLENQIKEKLEFEKAKAEKENAMCGKHRYAWKILQEILDNNEAYNSPII